MVDTQHDSLDKNVNPDMNREDIPDKRLAFQRINHRLAGPNAQNVNQKPIRLIEYFPGRLLIGTVPESGVTARVDSPS
jgi:hypothetical protein